MPNYSSPHYQLAKLLAYHENAAAAIRQTLALMAQGKPSKPGRPTNGTAHALLGDALALDTARRESAPRKPGGRRWSAAQRAEISKRMKARWKKAGATKNKDA